MQKLTLKERAVTGYWSLVACAGALVLSLQPVLADVFGRVSRPSSRTSMDSLWVSPPL